MSDPKPSGPGSKRRGPSLHGSVADTLVPSATKRRSKAAAQVATARAKLSPEAVFQATPLGRIAMIRQGVPAADAKRMIASLVAGQGAGMKALNLSVATVNKKAKQHARLSAEASERVVGIAKLVGQVEAMVERSGDPTGFDARAWLGRWLSEPLPALGGERPIDLLDTMEGQHLVSAMLEKIESGAYA